MGQPGARRERARGEVAHPQASFGRLGELHQDVVLGHGQVRLRLEVPLEGFGEQQLCGEPRAPGRLLLGGEPAGGGHAVQFS